MNMPPQAKAGNIFETIAMLKAMNEDVLGVALDSFEQYGDTFYASIVGLEQYVTRDPDIIRQIAVDDAEFFVKDEQYTDPKRGMARFLGNGILNTEGEFWKRQRKLMQPAFHHKRIEGYGQIMADYTAAQMATWQHGTNISVSSEMMALTMKIVVKALFDLDITADIDRIAEATEIFQIFTQVPDYMPLWFPNKANRNIGKAIRTMDDVVFKLIEQRRAAGTDNGDLLSVLLTVRDDEGNGMSDQQLRDELVTMLFAGHETTANTLNWTLYLLAQNPEQEAKLHAELDTVLAGRAPSLADLKQLPYTEQVIKESLRLYPPALGFGRKATKDMKLGAYDIPAGMMVNVFAYGTHRSPRLWPEPSAFKPERFAQEDKNRHKYAYFPFGAGARICIGQMFAMMEAQLLLASIAQCYRFRLLADKPVKADVAITLRPKGGLTMRVEGR
jgi:cytochrome P450